MSQDALRRSAGRSDPPVSLPCVGTGVASAEATKYPSDMPRGNWPPCAGPAFEDVKGGVETLALFMLRRLLPQLLVNRSAILMAQISGVGGRTLRNELHLRAIRRIPQHPALRIPTELAQCCDGSSQWAFNSMPSLTSEGRDNAWARQVPSFSAHP